MSLRLCEANGGLIIKGMANYGPQDEMNRPAVQSLHTIILFMSNSLISSEYFIALVSKSIWTFKSFLLLYWYMYNLPLFCFKFYHFGPTLSSYTTNFVIVVAKVCSTSAHLGNDDESVSDVGTLQGKYTLNLAGLKPEI
jgi:hypothetical protein